MSPTCSTGPRTSAAPGPRPPRRPSDCSTSAACWLRRRIDQQLPADAQLSVRRSLDACNTLSECRKSLVQRNANPQMVAEKALLAIAQAAR